jgi:type VI secretion system protein ImpE
MPAELVLTPRQEAEACFRNGDLQGCLQSLQGAVRKDPADTSLRVFLAQVLMVQGEWERALNQLKVIGEVQASSLPMVHAYSAAVQCERLRNDVFAGTRGPLLFGDPAPWIALQLQSVGLFGQGRVDEAAAVRAQAYEQAPTVGGTLNGEPFEWIADADSRLGPMLEVLLKGAYYWVPFERIASIVVEPPSDARDLVWLPAEFKWSNGGEAVGLIPVRYPGSEKSDDPAIRLARKTEWHAAGPDAYTGLGQRVLTTDGPEIGLLELRELRFEAAS